MRSARHDVRSLHGTPCVTFGCGHHGAPRLRSTTDHVHEGRDQTAETLTQATAPTSLRLKEVE
jgi:hypothetical protein